MQRLAVLFTAFCLLSFFAPCISYSQQVDSLQEPVKDHIQYLLRAGAANSMVEGRQPRFHIYAELGYRRQVLDRFEVSGTLFANSIDFFAYESVVKQCGIKLALRKHISKKVSVEAGVGWAAFQTKNDSGKGFVDLSIMYDDNIGMYVMLNPVFNGGPLGGNYVNVGVQASGKTLGYTGIVTGSLFLTVGLIILHAIGQSR